MIVGGIANLRGACPVCGTDVDRKHKWSGAHVGETYACPDCGDTEYHVARTDPTEAAAAGAGVHARTSAPPLALARAKVQAAAP